MTTYININGDVRDASSLTVPAIEPFEVLGHSMVT